MYIRNWQIFIGVNNGLNGFSWSIKYWMIFFGLDRALMTPVILPPATPAVVERLRDKVFQAYARRSVVAQLFDHWHKTRRRMAKFELRLRHLFLVYICMFHNVCIHYKHNYTISVWNNIATWNNCLWALCPYNYWRGQIWPSSTLLLSG